MWLSRRLIEGRLNEGKGRGFNEESTKTKTNGLPRFCVTPAGASTSLASRTNEMITHTHTHTHTHSVAPDQRFSYQVSLIPPCWEDQCEWHRMTRMTGPDCAVMCNLINTHTHTHLLGMVWEKIPLRVTAPRFELRPNVRRLRGYQMNHRGDRFRIYWL